MRLYLKSWLMGMAAVTCSCSSDQVPDDTSSLITINAVLDNVPGGRAADNENDGINRYVLEVYVDGAVTKNEQLSSSNSDGSFKLKLDIEKSYLIYCWADEGANSAYNVDNGLSDITLIEGKNPTIAHKGKYAIPANAFQETQINMPLTHAVAKIALQTQSALDANSARVDVLTYSGYDVIADGVTGTTKTFSGPVGPAARITDASATDPAGVVEFYTLVQNETCDVTLHYTIKPNDFTDTYATVKTNVPVAADKRTILVGDIAGLQFNTAGITAKLADTWTAIGNEVPIPGSGSGTVTEPEIPDNPEVPDTPSDPDQAINVSGKTNDAILAEIKAAVEAGSTEIKLTGAVSEEMFPLVDSSVEFALLDLSQTTGWESLDYTLPNGAFQKAQIGQIKIPEQIRTIGERAFKQSKITSIVLPGVQTLQKDCFASILTLKEIDAPFVTSIAYGALDCYNLKTLKLTANANIDVDASVFVSLETRNVALWLNESAKSQVETLYWKSIPWKSITFVDNDGSVVETI